MDISDEMREFILSKWHEIEPTVTEQARAAKYSPKVSWCSFPVLLDGVIDYAIWDIRAGCWKELQIKMADGPYSSRFFSDCPGLDTFQQTAVYCDSFQTAIIPLQDAS